MSNFQRITVERAMAAYEKTGLEPQRLITLGRHCGCPIGVVAVAEGMPVVNGLCQIGDASGFLGLPTLYRQSFTQAFDYGDDGGAAILDLSGHDDGLACRAAILYKTKPEPDEYAD